MYPEKDFWFYLWVGVSTLAIFVGVLSSVSGLGSTWIPWVAVAVFVVAILGYAVRAGLKAQGVVWTEEMRAEQRYRTRRGLFESLPLALFTLGQFAINRLSLDGVLPVWASCVLWVALVADSISLWLVIRRSSVRL